MCYVVLRAMNSFRPRLGAGTGGLAGWRAFASCFVRDSRERGLTKAKQNPNSFQILPCWDGDAARAMAMVGLLHLLTLMKAVREGGNP